MTEKEFHFSVESHMLKFGLGSTDVLVFAYLRGLQRFGKGAFASNEDLSKKFSVSKDSIKRILGNLEKVGFIKRNLEREPGSIIVRKRIIDTNPYEDIVRSITGGIILTEEEQPKKEVPEVPTKKTENKDKPKQTKETDNIPYEEIVAYLNEKLNKKIPFKSKTKLTRKKIKERWNEGFVLEDFKKVIDTMIYCWEGTKMEEHLTPKTLFGDNFETYLVKEKKKWVDFNEQKKSQQTTPTQTYNKFEFL